MKASVLIPHYGTGKMTAYSVAKFLKHKGRHDIDIVVIDNKCDDGSIEYLNPLLEHITVVNYPLDLLQSHGIAFDFILPHLTCDYFITAESDSFPESEEYFNYIEGLINKGYDAGGSLLKLSGGEYMHGCGAFYRKSVWEDAKAYCDTIEYHYFPNLAMKEGFACHTMIHHSLLSDFLNAPEDYVELADGYKGIGMVGMMDKCKYYAPVRGPFHNGMGGMEESVKTYGLRSIHTDAPTILIDNKKKIIKRIGYEPSQWLSYFMEATGRKIFYIPTETKWIDGRVGQQQEYTLMENGFRHLWAGSSFLSMKNTAQNDVYEIKNKAINDLYDTLPEYQKVK